uniref:BZIP domain-containing protein n=1 Tax=Strigamia maritima TaxID=126957 RepID=T1IYL8_STRMM
MQTEMICKRKSLSLDLNNPQHPSKKRKVTITNNSDVSVLSSPDMAKLKLTSSELEELLRQMMLDERHFPDSVNLPEIYLDSFVGDSSMEINGEILSSDSAILNFHDLKSEEKMLMMAMDVDMAAEKKREKNRIAATKCRVKKLETIEFYQNRVLDLKATNRGLEEELTTLKDSVRGLQIEVARHVNVGCEMMICDLI